MKEYFRIKGMAKRTTSIAVTNADTKPKDRFKNIL